ncbi:MAG: hypothetical protein QM703_11195 [Gemmatales bacterium]
MNVAASISEKLISAISDMSRLGVMYNGGGKRIILPCCIGFNSHGNELLRAYQESGYSEEGEPLGWKLFRVDRFDDVALEGSHFDQHPLGYNQYGDAAIPDIIMKL